MEGIAKYPVATSGPFSDLFQRGGPGTVPITDAAVPLSSFIDPVGGGWLSSGLPFPLAQIDSAANKVVWDAGLRIGVLAVAGYDDAHQIDVNVECNAGALALAQTSYIQFSTAGAAKHPAFQMSIIASSLVFNLLTSEDGQPDIIEGTTAVAATASFLLQMAWRRSTNTLAVKIGSNPVYSVVSGNTYATMLAYFAMIAQDLNGGGAFRFLDISATNSPTII